MRKPAKRIRRSTLKTRRSQAPKPALALVAANVVVVVVAPCPFLCCFLFVVACSNGVSSLVVISAAALNKPSTPKRGGRVLLLLLLLGLGWKLGNKRGRKKRREPAVGKRWSEPRSCLNPQLFHPTAAPFVPRAAECEGGRTERWERLKAWGREGAPALVPSAGFAPGWRPSPELPNYITNRPLEKSRSSAPGPGILCMSVLDHNMEKPKSVIQHRVEPNTNYTLELLSHVPYTFFTPGCSQCRHPLRSAHMSCRGARHNQLPLHTITVGSASPSQPRCRLIRKNFVCVKKG